jgi:hypothetical protein
VLKKYEDDKKHKKQREGGCKWAMDLVDSKEERMKKEGEKNKLSIISLAQMATDKYHILVSTSMLSNLKSRGSKNIRCRAERRSE